MRGALFLQRGFCIHQAKDLFARPDEQDLLLLEAAHEKRRLQTESSHVGDESWRNTHPD